MMYSYGPQYMAGQKQDDQLEHTSSSYVRIQDVALKTCQRRLTIGRNGVRGSGISVPVARHDDDDDDYNWYIILLSVSFTFQFHHGILSDNVSSGLQLSTEHHS